MSTRSTKPKPNTISQTHVTKTRAFITIGSAHTELIDKRKLVAEVIRTPDQVNKDKNYSDRKVIYKSLVLPEPWEACYVRVVVKYRKSLLKKGG